MKPTRDDPAHTEYQILSLDEGMALGDDYWGRLTQRATTNIDTAEMDPRVALEFWARWLVDRTMRKYDAVVLITGDEGTGKSTLALTLILLVSRLQGRPWKMDEVCYSALDLIQSYKRITDSGVKGVPVWYDEGVRGSSAYDNPLSPESKAVVKALALVRESGAILFALYPSVWLANKQIRARRACLWIHVVRRGLGRVHERDRRLNYLPTEALGLTISPTAPHVAWSPFAEDDPMWVDYLATKNAKLKEFLAEAEKDLKIDRGDHAKPSGRRRSPEPTAPDLGRVAAQLLPAVGAEARAARKREQTRARVARWRAAHRTGTSGGA